MQQIQFEDVSISIPLACQPDVNLYQPICSQTLWTYREMDRGPNMILLSIPIHICSNSLPAHVTYNHSMHVLKFFLFLTAKTGHWYNIFLLIKSWLIKFSGILFQYSCENEVLAKMKKEPCCTTTGLGGWVSSQLCQWYCRRPQKG